MNISAKSSCKQEVKQKFDEQLDVAKASNIRNNFVL